MKKSINLLILAFLLILSVGCTVVSKKTVNSSENKTTETSSDGKLTEAEKIEDFEYMYKILQENYPFFEVNKRLHGVDWLSNKEKYIELVKEDLGDEGFEGSLQTILNDLNNGHTHVLSKEMYPMFIQLYSSLGDVYKPWVDELMNKKATERYVLIKNENSHISSGNNLIKADNVSTEILEKDKTAYLAIKSFNGFNIEEDMKTIRPFLQSIKNYKVLIIDIRGNLGGSTKLWTDYLVPMLINKPLTNTLYGLYRGGEFTEKFLKAHSGIDYAHLLPIDDIKKYNLKNLPEEAEKDFKYFDGDSHTISPKDSIGFKGRIFLLVDKSVFSSSEAFAVFAKGAGFATLIGESTGGDGIGSDPLLCMLPNSGYIIRFSKDMGLASDGTCNFEHKTVPDIKVSAVRNSNLMEDEAVKAAMEEVRSQK